MGAETAMAIAVALEAFKENIGKTTCMALTPGVTTAKTGTIILPWPLDLESTACPIQCIYHIDVNPGTELGFSHNLLGAEGAAAVTSHMAIYASGDTADTSLQFDIVDEDTIRLNEACTATSQLLICARFKK